MLKIKPQSECKWDEVSLGEVIISFDIGDNKIQTARTFRILDAGYYSFASGLIYGFLTNKTPQQIVDYGVAHDALAVITPRDTTTDSLKEVEKLIYTKGARGNR